MLLIVSNEMPRTEKCSAKFSQCETNRCLKLWAC